MNITWKTSSIKSSPSGDNCVQVGFGDDGNIYIRSTLDPNQTTIMFNAGEWDSFVGGAKAGEFDR